MVKCMRQTQTFVKKLFKQLNQEYPSHCCNCENKLPMKIQDAWPENKEWAWLYIECPKCDTQNSLEKLIHTMQEKIRASMNLELQKVLKEEYKQLA